MMFETEDIEEDYFTPASSTSLANIFGKTHEQNAENESLKYTPPKPQIVPMKPEENKSTQCIFACALYGYEWFHNIYTAKGKLGFAIMKTKTGYHNIVLYDSNKTTLSCATISPHLEIIVKENIYMSYYDNSQRYWSICSKEDEIKKIINTLKSLDVLVKYSSDTEKGPPEPHLKSDFKTTSLNEDSIQVDKESDTDSSVNRRTKMSILNRMASMGHSVLPPNTLSTEKTSDSSDTNEGNYSKTIRHKPVKATMKRNSSEKNVTEIQSLIETHRVLRPEQSLENASPLYTFINGQLVPVSTSNILTGNSASVSDMNLFISEQRVSNSELRMNMNRITDKVDKILGKISDISTRDSATTTNIQIEILQKLLSEYENKIKSYEEIIKSKESKIFSDLVLLHTKNVSDASVQKTCNDVEKLNIKILELEQKNKEKDMNIIKLQLDLKNLEAKYETADTRKSGLLQENKELKEQLSCKKEELETLTKTYKIPTLEKPDCNDDHIKDRLKDIMNDTFHAVSVNFENTASYSGEAVKSIIAAIIKRVTIESLSAL